MERSSIEFLRDFINAMSPSGYEDEAREIWKERVKEFVDEVRGDVHGNAIGIINKKGKPRVMLAGHMDEIGYMVHYINKSGFLYFRPIGGIDVHLIPGERVWVKTKQGKILGVIGKKPIHLMEVEERKKLVKIKELFIDIGVNSKEEAEKLIQIGDPAVPAVNFEILHEEKVIGRGFDDKAGAFIVAEVLRLLSKEKKLTAAVYGVATVQEEVGWRGAYTSAYHINPDVGIAIDVTFATDYPSEDVGAVDVGSIKIGGGPVITRGANMNPKLTSMIIEVAKEEGIPYQLQGIPRGTGTDANPIQLTRGGVATGLVSIPNRYMHTPVELVSLKDLENIAKLLTKVIVRLTEDIDFTL
jgi:endoglucanase